MKMPTLPVFALFLLIFAFLGTGVAPAENRTWTQASSGRTIEGEFVKVEGDNVHIRRAGGAIIPVPVKELSANDQKYIGEKKAAAPAAPATADSGEPVTVALHDLHLCCRSCERAVSESVAEVEGLEIDIKDDIVTLKASSEASAQEAVNLIVAAGFYGKTDSHEVTFKGAGTKADKVKVATVSGVHLCCKSCVTAMDKAITAVDGVEGHTAKNKADSFEITGDFSAKEVLSNLRKAGMNATIVEGSAPADAEGK